MGLRCGILGMVFAFVSGGTTWVLAAEFLPAAAVPAGLGVLAVRWDGFIGRTGFEGCSVWSRFDGSAWSFRFRPWDVESTDHELKEPASRQEMKCLWKRTDTSANLRTDPIIHLPRITRLTNSFLVQAQKFISAYSAFLKRQGKLPIPGWVDTVKTSASNELPPQDADWYDSIRTNKSANPFN